MKTEVNRIALISALKTVRAAINRRSVLPILKMVKLTAVDGYLHLAATDMTAVITTSVKAKIITKGESCCVSPDKVLLLLDTLKTSSVTLLAKGKMMEISSGSALCITDIMPGNEFPNYTDKMVMRKAKPIIIASLVSAVSKVAYAMAVEDTRPVLAGLSMNFIKGEIELCGADGFRMATTRVKYATAHKFKKDDPRQFVVPREAIALFKLFDRDKVVMCIGDNYLRFSTPNITIGVVPIQGTYPNYTLIYPDPTKMHTMTFDRVEMLNALKAVIKQKDFELNPLRVETKRGAGVQVSSVDGDGHSLQFKVSGKGTGKIAFNPSLMRDTLSILTGPSVALKTTADKGPAMVKIGRDMHLLMPMYVNW